MDFPVPMLDPKANKEEYNFYITWTKANSTILRSIKLHLLEFLKAKYQPHDMALALITDLKAKYATSRISSIFVLFKELLDTKVAQSSYTTLSLNKVAMLFSHLSPWDTNFLKIFR